MCGLHAKPSKPVTVIHYSRTTEAYAQLRAVRGMRILADARHLAAYRVS